MHQPLNATPQPKLNLKGNLTERATEAQSVKLNWTELFYKQVQLKPVKNVPQRHNRFFSLHHLVSLLLLLISLYSICNKVAIKGVSICYLLTACHYTATIYLHLQAYMFLLYKKLFLLLFTVRLGYRSISLMSWTAPSSLVLAFSTHFPSVQLN